MHQTKLCHHFIKITKTYQGSHFQRQHNKPYSRSVIYFYVSCNLTLWMSVTGEAESGVANPSPIMSVPLGSAVGVSSSVTCSETAG